MPVPLVIATRNTKKFRELRALLSVEGFALRSLESFPSAPTVRETGLTFEANAIKKAKSAARTTGCIALADDSGLEVDALGGQPGVKSARFAGRHGDDEANNRKLLRLLKNVPDEKRTARFRCVLALVSGDRVLAVADGVFEGRIAREPTGEQGFGYDPIFFVPGQRKTSAQLSPPTKNRLSHRGQAVRRMRRVLTALAKGTGSFRPAPTAGSIRTESPA